MSSEKEKTETMTPDTISSSSDTAVNTNDQKVETDLEAQTNDNDPAPKHGQPRVQLGKVQLLLVMLGYVINVLIIDQQLQLILILFGMNHSKKRRSRENETYD